MNEIGVNLLGLKSGGSTNLVTFKFDGSNTGLRMNDGGADFTASTDVTFDDAAIYDFQASFLVGSGSYDWSVTRRDSIQEASATGWTFNGGTTLTNFSGIQFFWGSIDGAGNDGFIDSVSVIPEPSTYAVLFGLAALGFAILRRRKSVSAA